MSDGLREAIRTLGLDALRPQGLRAVLRAAGTPSPRQLVANAHAAANVPGRLQFRLRYFYEHQSTDSGMQGASDEVWISAIGTDSAAVVVGPGHVPKLQHITAPVVGDVSDDAVRDGWRVNPHVLLEFDLRRPASWPRTFTVTLLVVEEDNANLSESFAKLEAEVGAEIELAVTTAVGAAAGALAGAAAGSVVPGIGTAVGAAVGAIAAAAYDSVIAEIKTGLANEVFPPTSRTFEVPNPAMIRQHAELQRAQKIPLGGYGASYEIEYDWNLID